ncbi:AzlC family ABC transporter permease [Thalassococcus sp. S3]|uniref:AzlC family ABC transporter permease n=1 Tax=Thalassococcus sp. S3 TaxID=2017482 RepID=UPI0010242F84|nr:AzlC family ABC transporter permease [Thalassococcus sp. S3]QBF33536.1 branched-chain amino acid transporter AzlC [Thalassococcus sp. S3]
MTSSTTKSAFWEGFRAGAPFLLVIMPFATLFGVLATEAGLSVFESLMFSVAVIAGAAQFTALQLMTEDVPTLIVLASALAVNLRMAMYSASLTPYIGAAPLWQRALVAYVTVDQSYACSIVKFESAPQMSVPERIAYFFGTVVLVCPMWYTFTLIGAVIGAQIPPEFALDFALPITFLALIAPMLRTGAHVIAAATAIVVALLAAGIPYNLGLIVAGLCGMMAGAQAEVWLEQRKAEA